MVATINLQRAGGDFIHQIKKKFFKDGYMLILQRGPSSTGNICKKLKHGSIIIGYGDTHWRVRQLFTNMHTLVVILARNELACYWLTQIAGQVYHFT